MTPTLGYLRSTLTRDYIRWLTGLAPQVMASRSWKPPKNNDLIQSSSYYNNFVQININIQSGLFEKMEILLCAFENLLSLSLLYFKLFLTLFQGLNFFVIILDMFLVNLRLFQQLLLETHPLLEPVTPFLGILSFLHFVDNITLFPFHRISQFPTILDILFIDLVIKKQVTFLLCLNF